MQYHVAKNGEKSGPFEKEQVYRGLVAGELSGSDLGWCEGMANWEPLSKLIPPPTSNPAVQPVFGATTIPGAVPIVAAGSSKLALISMTCGILSFFTLGLTSIPAVIMGHIARYRITKSKGTLSGSGMALAGLIMGYLCIVLTFIAILAALAIPAFTSVQQKANQTKAMSNAKQLVIGMKQYAADHDGSLPPTLETLYDEKILEDRKLLIVPGTSKPDNGWEYRGTGLKDYGDGNATVLISHESYRSGERVVAHLNHVVQVERGEQPPKNE